MNLRIHHGDTETRRKARFLMTAKPNRAISFFTLIFILSAGWGLGTALAQSVYLNLTSPTTQVMGGQSVLYNLAYGNTGVPVTTVDTFEADTAGNMPAGWVTYGGSAGTVMTFCSLSFR